LTDRQEKKGETDVVVGRKREEIRRRIKVVKIKIRWLVFQI